MTSVCVSSAQAPITGGDEYGVPISGDGGAAPRTLWGIGACLQINNGDGAVGQTTRTATSLPRTGLTA